MTLRNSPLAVDGARIDAATLRTEAFMNGGRYPGVSSIGALKVSQLDVPGNGLKIAGGAASILNYYQDDPSEAYVASNLGEEVLGSTYMPPANTGRAYHLVVVTVGDPEFSQAQHPWMPATVPEGQEETFQYVRFHIIRNVPAGTRDFASLNLKFPAEALALLDVPANTTTFTNAMITDLRTIPAPRSLEVSPHIPAGDGASQKLVGLGNVAGEFQRFPNQISFNLDIPKWASRAYVSGFVEGLKKTKAGQGRFRVAIVGAGVTSVTNVDENAGTGRVSVNVGGEIAIPAALRGTSAVVRIEATPNNNASKEFLETHPSTSANIRVRLEEKVV